MDWKNYLPGCPPNCSGDPGEHFCPGQQQMGESLWSVCRRMKGQGGGRRRERERDREEQREDVLLEDYALLPSRGPVRWAGLSWVVVAGLAPG